MKSKLFATVLLALVTAGGAIIVRGQTTGQNPAAQKADVTVTLPPRECNVYTLGELGKLIGDATGKPCWVDGQCRRRRLLILLPGVDQRITMVALQKLIAETTGLRWRENQRTIQLTRMGEPELRAAVQAKNDERLSEGRHLLAAVKALAPALVPVSFDLLQPRYLKWYNLTPGDQALLTRLGSQARRDDAEKLRALIASPKLGGATIALRFDLLATLTGDPFPLPTSTYTPWIYTYSYGDLFVNREIPTLFVD